MSIEKRTGNEIPKPKIGKTHRHNRWTRFVDLNEYVDKLVDYTDAKFVALPESPNNGDALIYDSTTNSWISSISSSGGIEGTQYIFVQANGTPTENAQELQDAYNLAKTMSPSTNNRITVICGNGNYDFASNFTMDTEYIDLVSLDGNRSIIFNGVGTISITANDVFVKGVDVQTKNFTIGNNLNLLKVDNCQGGDNSFGFGIGQQASGTFTNCQGGIRSFGGEGQASGTFTNCIGGVNSFGVGGTLSGKLYYCRLTDGTFETVSGAGVTILCVDGNNQINTQN